MMLDDLRLLLAHTPPHASRAEYAAAVVDSNVLGKPTRKARELALLSRAVGRQVGLLIDRKGRVQMVIVGEPGSILIPELPRGRGGNERLRGLPEFAADERNP